MTINNFSNKNGVNYISFKPLNDRNVFNVFSNRVGGLSPKPYFSLNMGYNTGDNRNNVLTNRKVFFSSQEKNINNAVFVEQVHGTSIEVVDKNHRGKGVWSREGSIKDADGLITDEKDVILVTLYADCVPIYLYDPIKEVVAVVHAGWKGTLGGIGRECLKVMAKRFSSLPANCIGILGPSIGPCCYRVNSEFIEKFSAGGFIIDQLYSKEKSDEYYFDLRKANMEVLRDVGVRNENLYHSNLCTSCRKDMFFSHRAEYGVTGRMAAAIGLKG